MFKRHNPIFIASPPFNPVKMNDYECTNRYIMIQIQLKVSFNTDFQPILIFEIVDKFIKDGKEFETISFCRVLHIKGHPKGKLVTTIRGVYLNEISGKTSEMLMDDVFKDVILKTYQECLINYFPDWEDIKVPETKLEKETPTNIISLQDHLNKGKFDV